MTTFDVLQKIAAGYEAFDGIKIKSHERGAFAIRVGLRVSLKFADGHTDAQRGAFVRAFRSYYDVFEGHLTHWMWTEDVRKKRIRGFPPIEDDIAAAGPDNLFGGGLYGYEPTAATNAEPALYHVGGICERLEKGGENSDFSANIPASWAVRHGFDKVRALVIEWCGILKARHGTAGLSLLLDNPPDKYVESGLYLLKKFPGLDYEDESIFNVEVLYAEPRRLDRIRTINWLTVLDDGIVSELGGRDRIRTELEPDCPLFDYPGGIVIQAGPQPELGSYEDGYIPEAFRKVARLTRPVRFEAYRRGLFRSLEPPFDNLDETMKWIKRFD